MNWHRRVFESGLLTKVRATHKDLGDVSMRDAHHCRAQAELCLQIAGLLSDQEAAADLRTRAAEYLTHAVELEAHPKLALFDQRAA